MPRLRPAVAAVPLLPCVLAALLSACGGGGGGGGAPAPAPPAASPALTFAPATLAATISAGTSLTLNVGASVARPADFANAGTVFATLTDSTGVILPSAQVVRDSDTQYHAVLQTAPTLAAGSYRGAFSVRLCRDSACASQFPGSPVALPYEFQVLPAGQAAFGATSALPLTATAHLGGAAPAAASVDIAAVGRNWTAASGAAWLKLGATSGSGNATVAVSYDTAGLALGQYTTTLTVTASDGPSASLPVALTVLPSGLVFGGGSIAFTAVNGAPIPSQAVSLSTDNQAPLPWSAASDAAWLRLSPASGTTPTTTVLTLDPSVGPLASGTHTANVTLTSPGLAERKFPVNVTLVPATLLTSANSVTLGGTYGRDFATTQPLTLNLNTGTNSWPWTLANLPAWSTVSTELGTVNQNPASTVFTARPNNAAVGASSRLLTFSSKINGDTVRTDVLLTINKDKHKLIPSETGVALSGSPAWTRLTHTLTVSDNYGAFGGMSATSNQPWLVAGVDGANLLLTADPSQLLADTLSVATVTLKPVDPDVAPPEPIRVALWKGTFSPTDNLTLPLPYTTVVADPIRPYAYVHNGGAYIDVYNLYNGAKVATMTGFSASLGDMATSANGDYLLVHDVANARIVSVNLDTRRIETQTALAAPAARNTRLKVIRPNGVELLLLGDGTVFATDNWRQLARLPLTGGVIAASGDGKRVLQQDEGNASVRQSTVSVDYTDLGGGTLYGALVPVASHNGVGAQGQDIAVSADGTRIYSASGTPALCSVINPADLGVLAYLATGGAAPNNVEIDSAGRIYCGVAARSSGSDVWIYDGTGKLVNQKKLAAGSRQLLPRQLAVSGDARLMIGITDDGATTIAPVEP
nr:quinoprotein amine dehydrogenase [uncultured Duganella sp.]